MKTIRPNWLNSAGSRKILEMFQSKDHEIFFVGGCVRNTLMGEAVSDLDLATSAHPDEVIDLAKAAGVKVIPTGLEHGTVTLLYDSVPYEVTTFRNDIAHDGRHAVVKFSDVIVADATRRDFTINALYLSPDGTVHDPIGGLEDIEKRIVRFIGDPNQRIEEDYLRILRFFRFHAWYADQSLGINADGLAACAENIGGLAKLSRERVGSEIIKLLSAPNPAPSVAGMAASGILYSVLPGASETALSLLAHNEERINLEPDPLRRLAVLGGENLPQRLRLSKKQSKMLATFSNLQMSAQEAGYWFGSNGLSYLCVQAAMLGQEIDIESVVLAKRAALEVFPVNSQDLVARYKGAELGAKLRMAEESWIASGFSLTKEQLLD